MSIIKKKHKENPFVMIDKSFFEDPTLSNGAKGLMGYLLSRPDNWSIRKADLVKRSKDSATAIETQLIELMIGGYIYYYPERNPNGTVKEWIYLCFETPEDNPYLEQSIKKGKEKEAKRKSRNKKKNSKVVAINPEVDYPEVDNPEVDYPEVDNPPHNNNDFNNNDFNNNDFNNTYLLDIENSNLPVNIKAILKDQVGRLASDNIKLYEIENNFFSNEENINTYKYAETLAYCLGSTREPITNFSSLMNIYIETRNKMDYKASEKLKERVKKPVRTEKVFEYMDNNRIQEETIDLEELRNEIKNRNIK